MGCESIYRLSKMRLYWPKSIATNPIDNSLYILDENVIYKMTSFGTVEIVLGIPIGCSSKSDFKPLHSPVDMAFNPDGDLYILENDQIKSIKQIRILKSNGDLEFFIGHNEKDKENAIFSEIGSESFNDYYKSLSKSNTYFLSLNNPISIAVHHNRSVYVLDKGANVLYHIKNSIKRDEYTGKYTIISPDSREAYIFNRFGLHLQTLDLLTGQVIFNFTYSGSAFYGKLIAISDEKKDILSIKRDFHGRAESFQTLNSINTRVCFNFKNSEDAYYPFYKNDDGMSSSVFKN
jgi:hypothetical protein